MLQAITQNGSKFFMFFGFLTLALFGVTLNASQAYAEGGAWAKQEFKIKGEWHIVEEDGQKYLQLSDDFKTRNAPDLKLFLSPKPASSVNGGNATEGSVLVSQLSSNKGAQRYLIPANVNLSDFQSVVLHCEQYSKLWGASDLK